MDAKPIVAVHSHKLSYRYTKTEAIEGTTPLRRSTRNSDKGRPAGDERAGTTLL